MGQPEVRLLRNVIWLPNLVARNHKQCVVHFLGQMSCRGQTGQAEVKLHRNALCLPNLIRTPECTVKVEGHAGVSQGSNCLEMPYGNKI